MRPRSTLDIDVLRDTAPLLNAGARFWIGYSGGLDSTVLLHALLAAGVGPLAAIHVHHGLQPEAEQWVRHCAGVCKRLNVPLEIRRVRVDTGHGDGPEAAARRARYAAFASLVAPGDCLTLAHHLDDQAETVLLRLLRGTGILGLGAMRPLADFAAGRLWRPFLDVPRQSLRAWAEQRELRWVEDPQNEDRRYRRVWIRRELLPRMEAELPGVAMRLARTARLAAADASVLAEVAATDNLAVARGEALDISGLLGLSTARRHNVVRHWLRAGGFGLPPAVMLERLDREVLMSRKDAVPLLRFADCELRRYRDLLYGASPLPSPPAGIVLAWTHGCSLDLPPGAGRLVASAPPPTPLTISFMHGGERLRPSGALHTRSLKNLFQEAAIPPWRRLRTPMVALADRLAWVPGVAQTQAWQEWCRARAWHPTWQPVVDKSDSSQDQNLHHVFEGDGRIP